MQGGRDGWREGERERGKEGKWEVIALDCFRLQHCDRERKKLSGV